MQKRSSLAAWYALCALTITTLYALIDRQILSLQTPAIKAALHLTDAQIGALLGGGAVLFATIAAVPLGWLADKIDRRLLLAGCVLFWTAAVAACGLAGGFWSLLFCVSLLGVGEAGLSPIVYSMIPDLFSDKDRLTANFIYVGALVLGAGVGLAISGAVIGHIGAIAHLLPGPLAKIAPWRLAFFVVAAPGPFLAVAIATIRLKRREPSAPRGQAESPAENATVPQPRLLAYFKAHWKALLGTYVSFGLSLLGAGAVFIWLPVMLMRKFGATPGQVGAGFGLAVVCGSVAGLLISGVSANFLRSKWGEATAVRLPQIGFLLFALLSPLYLVARSPLEVYLIVFLQMAGNIAGTALSPTVYQDIAPARLRGRVLAISAVTAALIQSFSPILVGALSDHAFGKATNGLLLASVAVGAPCMLLAAVGFRLVEKHILATVRAVRAASGVA